MESMEKEFYRVEFELLRMGLDLGLKVCFDHASLIWLQPRSASKDLTQNFPKIWPTNMDQNIVQILLKILTKMATRFGSKFGPKCGLKI